VTQKKRLNHGKSANKESIAAGCKVVYTKHFYLATPTRHVGSKKTFPFKKNSIKITQKSIATLLPYQAKDPPIGI